MGKTAEGRGDLSGFSQCGGDGKSASGGSSCEGTDHHPQCGGGARDLRSFGFSQRNGGRNHRRWDRYHYRHRREKTARGNASGHSRPYRGRDFHGGSGHYGRRYSAGKYSGGTSEAGHCETGGVQCENGDDQRRPSGLPKGETASSAGKDHALSRGSHRYAGTFHESDVGSQRDQCHYGNGL